MRTELNNPVRYNLPVGSTLVPLNPLVGKNIRLSYKKEIYCIRCGRKTGKSFSQGFCYPCFVNSPENAECIIRPELCRAHLGEGRDIEWEKEHHLKEHFVYLAVSSGLKVGVTRATEIPTRWIDQGASKALPLAKTPNRYLAGCIEVALKKFIADKTNWQRMLKNEMSGVDLIDEKLKSHALFPDELKKYIIQQSEEITKIEYPVITYPSNVKSIGFDKTPDIEGVLMGIKGQYLIFDEGRVLNIRKHNGYVIGISY